MKAVTLAALLVLAIIAKAIKPEREYRFTPDMRGLDYLEYQVNTPDNHYINVWEYKLPGAMTTRRTVIIVGTDAGNMSYSIWRAKAFLDQGIRVIAFDYRGFGKSSEFAINGDYLFYKEFALDLDSVIRAAREKYPSDYIGLYAMSMGTYVSLLRKQQVDFSIAEGFYHNPQKIVERIKVSKGETVLLPENGEYITELQQQTPTMIFCASNDNVTVKEDAREFGRHNKVTLVEFDGDHLTGMSAFQDADHGDKYVSMIIQFLEKNGM